MTGARGKARLMVGTRGSALALAQTGLVCDALRAAHPGLQVEVERITTTGDARADVPLARLGRGMFVTEIETALRDGRIDMAVHSAKDLPSTLADDFTLAALLPRADARDVLVSRAGKLRELPAGARVGTSSPRRACQVRAIRPDLLTLDVRGNVDTRLRKLASGEYDALVLAAAGLIRLGRISEATEWLELDVMIPSVGQGALAIEVRSGDARTRELVSVLDHADTRAAVRAERAFLAELGAGCRAATGAFATVSGSGLTISAFIGKVDGHHVSATREGPAAAPEELGQAIARELLDRGGAAFLASAGSPLAAQRIAVTRPASQSDELVLQLRAAGAVPVLCPTIAIRTPDASALDAALGNMEATSWIVFTSANAVDAVADRVATTGCTVPESVRLAAVGAATANRLAQRIRVADFVPSRANGATLGAELPLDAGKVILWPRGDLALDELPRRLRERGAVLQDVIAYRTVAGAGARRLAELARGGQLDGIVFTSPSSIRLALGIADAVRDASHSPAVLAIGATTARAARDSGLTPDAEAADPSPTAIVDALERLFHERATLQPA